MKNPDLKKMTSSFPQENMSDVMRRCVFTGRLNAHREIRKMNVMEMYDLRNFNFITITKRRFYA